MLKLKVLYGSSALDTEWQDKSFKDENAAIEWCRRNYAKIACVNDYRTFFQQVSHFEIMDAIRGVIN